MSNKKSVLHNKFYGGSEATFDAIKEAYEMGVKGLPLTQVFVVGKSIDLYTEVDVVEEVETFTGVVETVVDVVKDEEQLELDLTPTQEEAEVVEEQKETVDETPAPKKTTRKKTTK